MPYAKSNGILSCPDDSFGTVPSPVVRCSYIANRYLLNPTYAQYTQPATLAVLNAPASTVLLYEGSIANNGGGTPTYQNYYDPTQNPEVDSLASFGDHENNSAPIATARHNPGSVATLTNNGGSPSAVGFTTGYDNYLLADGHVKFVRWETVSEYDLPSVGGSDPALTSNLGNFSLTFSTL